MNLLRSYPLLSFMLVLLGIIGLSIAQGSITMLLVGGALAAMSWYVTEGPRGRTLPRWVANILVIAVTLNVIVDLMQHNHDVLGALGRFTLWLTLIKLYERKTVRDHAQLLALALLLLLVGCLQSTDLLFGMVLLSFCVLGLYVLLLFQLYRSCEEARHDRGAAVPAGYRLAPPLRPVMGRRSGLQFRVLFVLIALTGLAASGIVFVSIPRGVGEGLFILQLGQQGQSTTGLSGELNLTSGTRISASRRSVAEVALRTTSNDPVELVGPLRLRGWVLNHQRGATRWTFVPRMPSSRSTQGDQMLLMTEHDVPPRDVLRMTVTPFRPSDVLLTMPYVVGIKTQMSQPIRYDEATQVLHLRNDERFSYELAIVRYPDDALLSSLVQAQRPRDRTRMPRSERVAELAARLLREANLPEREPVDQPEQEALWHDQAARVFESYLSSDEFTYSLDLSHIVERADGSSDPIEQFLFEHRTGHCEYFASAFASLCRNAGSGGIPARIVTGYMTYEYDEATQTYVVRESHAHAWNEVYLGGRRWKTFDATPAAALRELNAVDATLADQMRRFYERFDGTWGSNFIDFDRDAQAQLAKQVDSGWSHRFESIGSAILEWMQRVNRSFRFGAGGYIWMGIVGFALVIAVVALVKLMRRSLRIRRTVRLQHVRGVKYQRMLRQLGFYIDLLEVLRRAGFAKPAWCPPMMHAESLAPAPAEAQLLTRRITDLFYQGRYGGETLSREEISEVRSAIERLAQLLNVKAPRGL